MMKFGLFKDFTVLPSSIEEMSAFIGKLNLEFYLMTALYGKHLKKKTSVLFAVTMA